MFRKLMLISLMFAALGTLVVCGGPSSATYEKPTANHRVLRDLSTSERGDILQMRDKPEVCVVVASPWHKPKLLGIDEKKLETYAMNISCFLGEFHRENVGDLSLRVFRVHKPADQFYRGLAQAYLQQIEVLATAPAK